MENGKIENQSEMSPAMTQGAIAKNERHSTTPDLTLDALSAKLTERLKEREYMQNQIQKVDAQRAELFAQFQMHCGAIAELESLISQHRDKE